MTHGTYAMIGCALLMLCGACGDDDAANDEASISRGNRDGGGDGGNETGSGEGSARDGGSTSSGGNRDGGGAVSNAGDGAVTGSDASMTDAAAPPDETADAASPPEQPSDAAVAEDAAVVVTNCESLAACCEQLRDAPRRACERAIEDANDAACAELGHRACPAPGDGGMPDRMPCADVLPCCTALEGRQQTACEAAAAAPEGRACDRALETYCQ